jgi:hypothetical protein
VRRRGLAWFRHPPTLIHRRRLLRESTRCTRRRKWRSPRCFGDLAPADSSYSVEQRATQHEGHRTCVCVCVCVCWGRRGGLDSGLSGLPTLRTAARATVGLLEWSAQSHVVTKARIRATRPTVHRPRWWMEPVLHTVGWGIVKGYEHICRLVVSDGVHTSRWRTCNTTNTSAAKSRRKLEASQTSLDSTPGSICVTCDPRAYRR